MNLFSAINTHFVRAGPAAQATMLSAYSKLVAAHPKDRELRDRVAEVLDRLQDSIDGELQQRACEFRRILFDHGKLGSEVFMTMPPFADDVAESNPLIAKITGMSQSRAKTRNDLDVDATVTNSAVAAREKAQAEEEEEEEEEEERPAPKSSSRNGNGLSEGPGNANGAQDGWAVLCLGAASGALHAKGPLQLNVMHEYSGGLGKIAVQFANVGNVALGYITAVIEETPAVQVQQSVKISGATLGPGAKAVQQLMVKCTQPFPQAPKYSVSFATADGARHELSLMLPCPMTRFMKPTDLAPNAFMQHWKAFEHQAGASGSVKSQEDLPKLFTSANFSVVYNGDKPWNPERFLCCCGAALFQTAAVDQSSRPGSVPCIVKFDVDTSAEKSSLPAKVTVRSTNASVSQGVAELFQRFFLVR
jgi:hypothetical protein